MLSNNSDYFFSPPKEEDEKKKISKNKPPIKLKEKLSPEEPLKKYFQPTLDSKTASKKLRFSVSHALTKASLFLTKWNAWDRITDHLYLGIIPTKDMVNGMRNTMTKLKLVVSCLEPFELNGSGIWGLNTAKPNDWLKLGINHHTIIIEDYTGSIETPELYETIKKMHTYISNGLDVYVHCKAGVGRSAMAVLAYLAVYGKISKEENQNTETLAAADKEDAVSHLYQYLRQQRPQVKLRKNHLNKVKEVVEYHKNINAKLLNDRAKWPDLETYLKSDEVKKDIIQLPAFKSLQFYLAEVQPFFVKCKRVECIKQFLNKIANNEMTWYQNLSDQTGPINGLLEANPFWDVYGNDRLKRQTLVKNLLNDLNELIERDFLPAKTASPSPENPPLEALPNTDAIQSQHEPQQEHVLAL